MYKQQSGILDIEGKNYWVKKLSREFEITNIKYYDDAIAQKGEGAEEYNISFDTKLCEKLNKIANNMDFLLYVVLLTGLNICLKKYTGKSNIVIGSPTLKQNEEDTNRNVIPIINEVQKEDTFRKLLGKVRANLLSDIEMQAYPYTQLMADIGLNEEEQFPLFDIAFSLTNIHNQMPDINNSITIKASRQETSISLAVSYNSKRYQAYNIKNFIKHYINILNAALDNTDAAISELDMLSPQEKNNILVEWNKTNRDYPKNKCIHELFIEQVNAAPNDIAVVFGEKALTYKELDQKSNQLAHYLVKSGVHRNDRVAICIQPSLEMIIGLYAVLKSGAGYIPIDAKYPTDRIKFMLEDSKPALLITKGTLAGPFENTEIKTLYVDETWSEIEKESQICPVIDEISTSNLAYIIYTSGSTGEPKGSAVYQGGWTNLLIWFIKQFNFTKEDKVLLVSSFSFDLTQKNLFAPLLVGGQLHIRDAEHYEPAAITSYIYNQQITSLNCTPSAFYPLIDDNIEELQSRLVSLRCLFLGGEPISMARLKNWIESGTCNAEIYNTYGPTECTDICSSYKIDKQKDIYKSSVPVGTPIYNTQLYILNQDNEAVPAGIAGELCISGDGVGMGYINDEELTRDKFIKHPCNDNKGSLLYKTGDLAYYLPDGNIQYIGRADNQVKIRGFRIELGEIEKRLNLHKGVQEAAVVVNEGPTGDKRLIAYILPHHQNAFVVRKLLEMKNNQAESGHSLYETNNGMTIFHLNRSETEFIYREIFEEKIYLKNGITLTDNCTILDIGANIGMFSLFVSTICKNADIYAFEPIKPIFNVLQQNVELYALDRVKAFEVGLSDSRRKEDITFYPNVSIMSGRYADDEEDHDSIKTAILHEQKLNSSGVVLTESEIDELVKERLKKEVYQCQLDTISNIITDNNIETVDLLKIDVEKSEMDILEGIDKKDWAKIKQIILEVHDHQGRLEQICNILETNGFAVTAEKDSKLEDNDIYNVYAIHTSSERLLEEAAAAKEQEDTEYLYNSISVLTEDIKQWLSDKLPEYMLPQKLILLNKFPLSPNGKVDRQALSKLDISLFDEDDSYVAPSSEMEIEMEKIWAQVLDMKKVSVEDNFTQLGGYSLLATAIISKVRKKYNVEIPIYLFFENATIRKFVQLIESLILERQ